MKALQNRSQMEFEIKLKKKQKNTESAPANDTQQPSIMSQNK